MVLRKRLNRVEPELSIKRRVETLKELANTGQVLDLVSVRLCDSDHVAVCHRDQEQGILRLVPQHRVLIVLLISKCTTLAFFLLPQKSLSQVENIDLNGPISDHVELIEVFLFCFISQDTFDDHVERVA